MLPSLNSTEMAKFSAEKAVSLSPVSTNECVRVCWGDEEKAGAAAVK